MDKGTTRTRVRTAPPIIERPRLTKILDESTARTILLVAPAGYGKTTLARQWLRDKPHAWYHATSVSADPVALARGLERALRGDSATLELDEVIRGNAGLATDVDALAGIVVEAVPAAETVLVIDDYQEIAGSAPADDLVRTLATHAPIRLLVATRVAPPWASARDILYGEALRIETPDLALDAAEMGALFDCGAAASFEPALTWPLLAALVAASGNGAVLPAGQPALVYEYLAEELLAETSEELEAMLQEIALAPSRAETAERRTPTLLADALSRGLVQRPESPAIHPVLADLLKRRFESRSESGERLTQLVRELLDEERCDEAFALIDEFDRADLVGELLERAAAGYLRQGRFRTVAEWVSAAKRFNSGGAVLDYIEADGLSRAGHHLEALRLATGAAERYPDSPLRAKALILAARGAYLAERLPDATALFTSAFEAAVDEVDACEALYGLAIAVTDAEVERPPLLNKLDELGEEDPETALRVATVRIFEYARFGPVQTALRVADRADPHLQRVTAPWSRSAFLSMKAHALMLAANYAAAAEPAARALEDLQRLRFRVGIGQVRIHAALSDLGQGRFSSAARAARVVEAEARQTGDAYLLAGALMLQIRTLAAQGLGEEALRVAIPPCETTASAIAELWVSRALAAAIANRPRTAVHLASRAEALTRSIETKVLAKAVRAIVSRGEDELLAFVHASQVTGNLDGAVVALRASADLADALTRVAERHDDVGLFTRLLLDRVRSSERTPRAGPLLGLSPREAEVLDLIKQGLSNKEIAKALYISDVTVKVHVRHIFEKLGVRTRVAAVLVACDTEA